MILDYDSQTTFTLFWEYISPAYNKVSLFDADGDETKLTYGTQYTVSGATVTLLITPPTGTEEVKIYRETPSDRLVEWQDGSRLVSRDMTIFELQILHLTQEAEDRIKDVCLSADPTEQAWDMKGYRLTNVGDPEADTDAVTVRYMTQTVGSYLTQMQTLVQQAATARNEAESAATRAEGFADAVENMYNDIVEGLDTKMDADRITVSTALPTNDVGSSGDLWFLAAVPDEEIADTSTSGSAE